jgi:hypothetical protein
MLKVKVGDIEPVKQDVYQPYEEKDKHTQQQLIQEYQTKIHQLQAEVQQ